MASYGNSGMRKIYRRKPKRLSFRSSDNSPSTRHLPEGTRISSYSVMYEYIVAQINIDFNRLPTIFLSDLEVILNLVFTVKTKI